MIILSFVAPTAAPQNVNGSATGSSSLSLYWSPPPSQHQNGRIRYYHINVTDETTNTHTSFRAYNTQWTVFSLHPYTSYLCGVAAVTVAQGPSAFITIQTNQSGTSLIQYKFPSDSFRCNNNLILKYNFIDCSFSNLLRSSQILFVSCSPYTVAPTVNSTVCRNATAILITLQPLTQRESRGAVIHYNIRYRGFEPLDLTCNGSNLTMSTTSAATYMD